MIRAECRTYDQFKTAYARLLNWYGESGRPVPPPILFSATPGMFTIFGVFKGDEMVLRVGVPSFPPSFSADFPDAIEVGALAVV